MPYRRAFFKCFFVLRIRKKQRVDRRYVLIKKDIDFDQFERNRLNIERSKISGIRCTVSFRRTYPKNQMLANILGFTTIDRDQVIAKSGLEKYFNDEISPETGIKVVEVSRKGVTLNTISQKPEHDGYDLFLTIREPIQAILEEEIDKMMEATQAQHGFAIMADPYTGDIIALAQRPTFNPNDRSTLKEASSRNPVAEMAFEPGSIMKPFPVAGALDLGIISPETRFDCEQGRWFFAGKILRDTHKLGRITVSEIIQHSSNIGTAKIALEIGEPRLKNILTSFGFGQRTGAPLRPETVGLFYRNPTKISITRYPRGSVHLRSSWCAPTAFLPTAVIRFSSVLWTGFVSRTPTCSGNCRFSAERNCSAVHRPVMKSWK